MSTTVPLGTKGQALAHLIGRLRSAEVLPLALVDHASWRADRAAVVAGLLAHPWAAGSLIVRSSALTESAVGASQAGRYLTIPSVSPEQHQLAAALDGVFASYGALQPADEVLVQPELLDVASAGVATTHDPTTGAPYTVISWAERDTSTVTSGHAGEVRTWYGAAYTPPGTRGPAPVRAVLALLAELRELTGQPQLVVEWALSADALVLLQVRPLGLTSPEVPESDHHALLTEVDQAVRAAMRQPGSGPRAYGVMPDWNPAEILGSRPRPLARSLYGFLITDRVWSRARARYGYRDPHTPLLVDFGGLPYVDVRASVASLIPRDLPTDAATRLVDAYVAHLISEPHLHDKLESQVVVSSLGLRAPSRVDELARLGLDHFDVERLRGPLAELTFAMVDGPLWEHDLARVESLLEHVPDRTDPAGLLARLCACRDYGSEPFAALARCAFVATELLDDLVAAHVLTPDDRAAFVRGLDLVSGQLQRDFHALRDAQLLSLYGHLRPGTWDIRSPRYDEDPTRYFDWSLARRGEALDPPRPFQPTPAQLVRIDQVLTRAGLPIDPQRLLDFIAATIRGRERAKFLYTRVLSDVLRDLTALGESHGFGADDMSYIDLRVLHRLTGEPVHDTQVLADAIAAGRQASEATAPLELPPLLSGPEQVWAFTLPRLQPTYVTRSRVTARVARVDAGEPPDGAVALIESADPGYDWILTRDIAALITAWGGVNSHMAVRAIELGIPAAIGVGREAFRKLYNAHVVDLDAGARTLAAIS